ncbi:hypothetical protein OG394_22680 [Kribbella sp. NBC_01245]|uniref:hypothetical protein n=1 Tax=Kribbella sp. NBC_01245 TaxID=2903578 RepID=UPI002E2A2F09|nr:hypothetical protein [Kribbella sp. NBC_01245]
MRRPLLLVGFWTVAVLAATGIGLLAVSFAGPGLPGAGASGDEPLTGPEVSKALATRTTPTAGTPAPSQVTGKAVPFRQLGNYVLASCGTNGLASLLNFTPAGGWQVDDDVQRGPAAEAEVKFEGPDSDLKVRVQCRAGAPVFTPEVQPD